MSAKPGVSLEPLLGSAALAGESERRSALLRDAPKVLGATWADVWCRTMRNEGRPIDGGWPGTLQEARSRVQAYFERELPLQGLQQLTRLEFDAATMATYERARSSWLATVRECKVPHQGSRR